jgi:hypothetical protein
MDPIARRFLSDRASSYYHFGAAALKLRSAPFLCRDGARLDAVRHLAESSGKTHATVAPEAGQPESTLSEVLLRRRRLNTRHI